MTRESYMFFYRGWYNILTKIEIICMNTRKCGHFLKYIWYFGHLYCFILSKLMKENRGATY